MWPFAGDISSTSTRVSNLTAEVLSVTGAEDWITPLLELTVAFMLDEVTSRTVAADSDICYLVTSGVTVTIPSTILETTLEVLTTSTS